MKYFLTVVFSTLFSVASIWAQEAMDSTRIKKDNPIVFAEFLLGLAGGSANGGTLGFTANYQENNNLYSFRYINQRDVDSEYPILSFVLFPFFLNETKVDEFSLLYGRRTIKDGQSLSFSAGMSLNLNYNNISNNELESQNSNTFIGFPFELNIKWFKKEKKRFRAYYGIIPVGKPTSFGRSFGFKLYGNFGKLSYVGIGINYGFGWHKGY